MIKLIVFDWDGTLADSVRPILACKQFLAQKYSLAAPTEETVRQVLGTPFEQALARCFPAASPTLLHQIGQEFHTLMQQAPYQAALFPETKTMLLNLKQSGIKLAIATSKDRRELDAALKYHGITSLFDITCSGKEYQEKPHPAMLLHILQELKIQANECWMVGDTTTDLYFANNARIKAIGVTFGAHSKDTLECLNPFALIDAWSQFMLPMDNLCLTSTPSISCRL